MSGATRPSSLQVVLAGTGIPNDAPFIEVGAAARANHTVYFAAADYQEYSTNRPFIDLDQLTDLSFKVPSNDVSTTPFDYCVSDVELIYGGDELGGVPLTPNIDAWIGPGTNTLGHEGSFWTYGDGSSTLTPTPDTMNNVFEGAITGGEVCMSGSLSTYSGGADNWGGGLGVSFGTGFDAVNDNVIGFRYELVDQGTGPNDVFNLADDRAGLEFFVGSGAGPGNTDALPVTLPGSQVVLFEDLTGALALSQVVQLQWQATSDGTGPKSFDFCIRNMEAIVSQ